MEISPMSVSRWWRKDEVGAEPEAEDLKGVRGGGVLVDDMVWRRPQPNLGSVQYLHLELRSILKIVVCSKRKGSQPRGYCTSGYPPLFAGFAFDIESQQCRK